MACGVAAALAAVVDVGVAAASVATTTMTAATVTRAPAFAHRDRVLSAVLDSSANSGCRMMCSLDIFRCKGRGGWQAGPLFSRSQSC